MRLSAAVALCCLCTIAFAADPAHASIRKDTNIPAGGLGPALETLAKDYDFQVLYRTEIVKDRRTQGAVGSLTSDEALIKVLSGTGLSYKYLDASTVTIVPVALLAAGATTDQAQTSSNKAQDSSKEAGKNSSREFLLAQATPGQGSVSPSVEQRAENPTQPTVIQEVIVTAEKRSEKLQEVPVPVSVVSADELVSSDQTRLADFYTRVPGLSVSSDGSLYGTTFAIRGITTGGFGNPTVGITIDDVPLASATTYGAGSFSPDIDPSQLARIEVLRGPQGTLYGASSMGGLLKYITVDPSTTELSGRVEAGGTDVFNGNGLGYNARGSVNVPLADSIAILGSGFVRQEPGYIDNPVLNISGVNKTDAYGGRLSALWRPSSEISLKISALYQKDTGDGYPYVQHESGLGDLQQNFARGSGRSDFEYGIYTASLVAKLGTLDFTSVSGFIDRKSLVVVDLSPTLGFFSNEEFGVSGAVLPQSGSLNKFTQEFRLSAPVGERLEWLLGVFYTHEKTFSRSLLLAVDPAVGTSVGETANIHFPTTFEEYAGFANLTYHFTDRFDVQIGGRESKNRQSYQETDQGLLFQAFDGGDIFGPKLHSEDDSFTYLVTPRFRFSPDLMAYARIASGYRAGGLNTTDQPGVPPTYSPDKTQNYEFGVKSDVLNHALSLDASVYYIDWKDIQLSVTNGLAGYFANGSRAKSQGVELSVEARPLTSTTISSWIAYNDAKLTEDLPSSSTVIGVSGDRLPYSSRFSGNLAVDQRFAVIGNASGLLGASVSYVGDRKSVFTGSPQRQDLPAYTKLDAHASLLFGSWTVNAFANNIADRRGLLAGGIGFSPANSFGYIQPRTVGLSVAKVF